MHDLTVQSHGIPDEVIDNTINGAKEFFARPDDAKIEVGSINLDLSFHWLRGQCTTVWYTQDAQLQRVHRSSRWKHRLDRAWGSSWRVWYRLGTQDKQCDCSWEFVISEGWCNGWRECLAVWFAWLQGNHFGILVRPRSRNCHYDVRISFLMLIILLKPPSTSRWSITFPIVRPCIGPPREFFRW